MIIITENIALELESYLSSHKQDKIFALTDANSREKCLPLLNKALSSVNAEFITIEAGDIHKNLGQVAMIWEMLSKNGASRNSLLINIGGGMVTDLGGFAGATFKRGLHVLNVPTTLMASVDAAVGGKTGVNFNGLKNEIGSFYLPDCVMIDCSFLKTLDRNNLLSGYAEMIKHGLISDPQSYHDVMAFDMDHPDMQQLTDLVGASVTVKERIATEDPKETGPRKALNFGHTVGHALESLSFAKNNPILHGHAVAAGLVCELYLSHKICGMPIEIVRQVTRFVKEQYPPLIFGCDHYDALYDWMTHDKKNEGGHIFFVLLANIGNIRIHQELTKEQIMESLDFYRENIY
jgi:3-dehydroquinate synthase